MTDKEKQELFENICNDISCGTYTLAPQYVDKLLAKLEKENAEFKNQLYAFDEEREKLCKENTLARELLGKWYGQHSEKGYTETFYQNLLKETERLLWSEVKK